MLFRLIAAWSLMALCVVAHAAAMPVLLRWLQREGVHSRPLWPWINLFVHLAGAVVLLHLAEIAAWAFFYVWQGAMPTPQPATAISSSRPSGGLLAPWRR